MSILSRNFLKKYIVSILISILATLVVLGVISVVFSFLPPSPGLMNAICNYSYVLTVFLSSFICAKSAPGRGLLTGIITALTCLFIISVAGSVFFEGGVFLSIFLKRSPLAVLFGAIGGILGINSK